MIKFLRSLASLARSVDEIFEIGRELKGLQDEVAEMKCEMARQGEELDMIYQQHMQAFSPDKHS